jgi:NAD-dependent deacetylase
MDPKFSPSLRQHIENAEYVTVLTGAGVSAESGVATFRGKDGLWAKYRPEELASPSAFAANPELVWAWYQDRRGALLEAQPNPGHVALVQWEELAPRFALATQNVDGLHRIPRCECGGLLRPGVVWFGEPLPQDVLERAFAAAQQCDLFLTIGTSALVYPAAGLPEVAAARGTPVIEINTEETPFTRTATHHLCGPSGRILPQLVAIYEAARRDPGRTGLSA